MTTDSLIRLPDLMARTGLSRTAVYDRLDPKSSRHDPDFPRPVPIGARAVAWSAQEIEAWITTRKSQRAVASV